MRLSIRNSKRLARWRPCWAPSQINGFEGLQPTKTPKSRVFACLFFVSLGFFNPSFTSPKGESSNSWLVLYRRLFCGGTMGGVNQEHGQCTYRFLFLVESRINSWIIYTAGILPLWRSPLKSHWSLASFSSRNRPRGPPRAPRESRGRLTPPWMLKCRAPSTRSKWIKLWWFHTLRISE